MACRWKPSDSTPGRRAGDLLDLTGFPTRAIRTSPRIPACDDSRVSATGRTPASRDAPPRPDPLAAADRRRGRVHRRALPVTLALLAVLLCESRRDGHATQPGSNSETYDSRHPHG